MPFVRVSYLSRLDGNIMANMQTKKKGGGLKFFRLSQASSISRRVVAVLGKTRKGRGNLDFVGLFRFSRGVAFSLRVHSRAPSFFPFSVECRRPRLTQCPPARAPVHPSPPAPRRLPASASKNAPKPSAWFGRVGARATATRPCGGVLGGVCACPIPAVASRLRSLDSPSPAVGVKSCPKRQKFKIASYRNVVYIMCLM